MAAGLLPQATAPAPPATTALIVQECQRGVIGQDSLFPQLAEAAKPAVPFIVRLVQGARRSGVPVVHSLATTRADGYGEPRNAPLFRMAARAPASRSSLVPRDAVAGVPPDYAEAVIEGTLRLPARVERTEDVLARWNGGIHRHNGCAARTGHETRLRGAGVGGGAEVERRTAQTAAL